MRADVCCKASTGESDTAGIRVRVRVRVRARVAVGVRVRVRVCGFSPAT